MSGLCSKMRVLIVSYEWPPIGGGSGRALFELVAELAELDVQFAVLTSHEGNGMVVDSVGEAHPVFKVGCRKGALHYWTRREVIRWVVGARRLARKLLRDGRYEYNLAHVWAGLPSGWAISKSMPYIVSLRGSDVPGFNRRLSWDHRITGLWLRGLWRRAAAIVANSAGLRDLANRFEPIDAAVIPNGVNRSLFGLVTDRKVRTPLRLLSVGRLIPRKRMTLAIETLAALRGDGTEAVLRIVGDGPEQESLSAQAQRLGVAEMTEFVGQDTYDKMPEHYAWGDVYLAVSEHEGMSNAMLEGLSTGLPVAAAEHEGAEMLPEQWRVGGDPRALAELVGRIAAAYDENVRKADEIARRFSWAAVAKQYLELYRKVYDETALPSVSV